MGRQPRERPISCHFCRVRKLRCSRQFPCSNCTSRGVACQQGPDVATAAPSAPVTQRKHVPDEAAVSEMLSRLEKLEGLVASQGKELELTRRTAYPGPAYGPTSVPSRPSVASSSTSSSMPTNLQRLTNEALWLEETCTGPNVAAPSLINKMVFRTCAIYLIRAQPTFIFNPESLAPSQVEPIRCIWLPLRGECRIIVQKYIEEITHFHHVVHIPSLWKTIDKLYDAIEDNGPIELGSVILTLSICATVTYAWTPWDAQTRCLFSTFDEAHAQTSSWLRASLDVVDHAERTVYASIESIQGIIVLFFVACNVEGITQRARAMVARCVTIARELSLHRIDSLNTSGTCVATRMSEVEAEIGRRVWWYLVATDWMMAQFCRPHEGTYTVHMDHMVVNKPRNLRDDDLVDGKEVIPRSPDEPTETLYLIQRLRLAEICREMLDEHPLAMVNPSEITYEQVLRMDAKLVKFMEEIPPVLRMDHFERDHLLSIDNRLLSGIALQRYSLSLIVHRQRCRLYLPYLARSAVEPSFAHARRVCVDSAKAIVQMEQALRTEHIELLSSRLRIMAVLRSIYVATIALVLDACLTNGSGEPWNSEAVVADAWKILQEAQGQSQTAGRLLELSMQVLRSHNVAHPALEAITNLTAAASTASPQPVPLPMTPESAHRSEKGVEQVQQQQMADPELETAFLERQWQALDGRMDLDAIDWEKLFWGLDAPFM